jgi:hypothetical protein
MMSWAILLLYTLLHSIERKNQLLLLQENRVDEPYIMHRKKEIIILTLEGGGGGGFAWQIAIARKVTFAG